MGFLRFSWILYGFFVSKQLDPNLIFIDSGCGRHMVPDDMSMSNYQAISNGPFVQLADNRSTTVQGSGSIHVQLDDIIGKLTNVLHVENLGQGFYLQDRVHR